MSFAGKVWRLLVGIKDGLSLLFLLLFFSMLFALLSARPSPGQVREGALLLDLNGYVVEERSEVDPIEALLAAEAPLAEYPARDLVRALNAAAGDDRIKAVVLDLSKFMGGGQVHLQEVAEALDRVRAADKPVLAYALGYGDDAMMLAAHASEVWVDPLGGAVITGPGGSRLYYADLFEKLGVKANIYRVGTFKSAVEPYARNSMSDEARENYAALYGALWEEWQANVKKARPNLQLALVTTDPVGWVENAKGDLAQAALNAGLVDKLGSKVEFGQRVAEIAGADEWSSDPGAFAATDLAPWLADNPAPTHGRPIGVITIAGELVDGDAGPGTAGGDRIAGLLNDALDDDLAALVVRVDSPGGSILASEEVRRAILRHKAQGTPIAVSMANLAASGGYWVSTPADRIFAQPETITGSIGVFAVIPSFEAAAAKLGVNADGFRTTPLAGQPDLVAGFNPEVNTILQGTVESNYAKFLGLVAKSRGKSAAEIDTIAQGRVWDGGSARQLGLVDQFGGLDDALAWAAKQAKLEDGKWHAQFLGTAGNSYDSLIRRLVRQDAGSAQARDLVGQIAGQQDELAAMLAQDVARLSGTAGVQVYCLECPRTARSSSDMRGNGWLALLGQLVQR